MDKINKIFNNFCNIMDFLSGILLVALTVVVLVEVVGRYFFGKPFTITYDLSMLLFPWIVMISMITVTYKDEHLRIIYFRNKLGGSIKKINSLIINVLIVLFIYLMLTSSIKLSISVLYSKVGTWRMPQPLLYLPLVFSFGVILCMICIRHLVVLLNIKKKKRLEQ